MVDPPDIHDANGKPIIGDDGVNVWLDGDFRVHMADTIRYQKKTADPLVDPWRPSGKDGIDAPDGMAQSPIVVPGKWKGTYATFYVTDNDNPFSRIDLIRVTDRDSKPDPTR